MRTSLKTILALKAEEYVKRDFENSKPAYTPFVKWILKIFPEKIQKFIWYEPKIEIACIDDSIRLEYRTRFGAAYAAIGDNKVEITFMDLRLRTMRSLNTSG